MSTLNGRYYLESNPSVPVSKSNLNKGTVAVSSAFRGGGGNSDTRLNSLERTLSNIERRSSLLEDENAKLRSIRDGIKDLANRL